MAKLSAITTPSLTFDEGSAPSTPSSGDVVIYAKTDGLVYSKDDAGTETLMSSGTGGSHTAHGVTVTRSSTAIAQSGVAISWDAEVRDDGGMWAVSPNPTRITIPADGWYSGTVFVTHAADNDGGRRVFWRVDNTTTVGRSSTMSGAAMNDATVMASFIEYLTTSNYLEVVADQNAGGNLNITARASVVRIPFS